MMKQNCGCWLQCVLLVLVGCLQQANAQPDKPQPVTPFFALETALQDGKERSADAYSKAAEMAATLKDSGSNARAPYRGELGWPGGLVIKVKSGYVIAAFSGGPSEDDLKCARAGVDILGRRL